MVDVRKLKELIKLMADNDLSELDLRDGSETVVIKRAGIQGVPQVQVGQPIAPASSAPAGKDGAAVGVDDPEAGLVAITSPMVGTLYSAPDPESPPYVTVGTSVSDDSVVCIVEAMKVFSEIKAECSGTIEKVLIKNGEPVEFGQKLYLVRPS